MKTFFKGLVGFVMVSTVLVTAPVTMASPALRLNLSTRSYREGLKLLKHRQFTQAADYFRSALRSHPEDAKIWFALGVSLYKAHNLTGAYQAYVSGLKLLPKPALQARLRGGLGDVFFEQQDFEQAISAYVQALSYQPNWTGVRLKLATALLREKRFSEALFHSELLQKQSLPPAESLYLSGLIYLGQQNQHKAIAVLEQLAVYPDHAFNARQMLSWLYREQEQWPAYLKNNAALKKLASQYPQVYSVLGFGESQRYFSCFLVQATPCEQAGYLEGLQRWRLSGVGIDNAHHAMGLYYQLHQRWAEAQLAYQQAYAAFPERLDYKLKSLEMAHVQTQQSPRFFRQLNNEALQSRWHRRLSAWPETGVVFSVREPSFWAGFLKQPWFDPPTEEAFSVWDRWLRELKTKKMKRSNAEQDIVQAWKLWQANEKPWALRLFLQARVKASDWWLPHALWGVLALQSPSQNAKERAAAYEAVEIALALNPMSLRLTQVRLQNKSVSASIFKQRLQQALTTFPQHKPFQQLFLESLSAGGP